MSAPLLPDLLWTHAARAWVRMKTASMPGDRGFLLFPEYHVDPGSEALQAQVRLDVELFRAVLNSRAAAQ